MKTNCYKCKQKFETGLKYKEEIPRRPLCEKCWEKLEELNTLEEKWGFFKQH